LPIPNLGIILFLFKARHIYRLLERIMKVIALRVFLLVRLHFG